MQNHTIETDRVGLSNVAITPTLAARWMERNTKNRNFSMATSEKYRQDMLSGRWIYNGDPIRFAKNGRLLDGQHRLDAISRSPEGFSVLMAVVRGLDDSAQEAMDQGRKRSPGDMFTMLGERDGGRIAAAVRLYILWAEEKLFKGNNEPGVQISTPRLIEWREENPDLVAHAHAVHTHIRNTDLTPSVGLAAAMIFCQISEENSYRFFRALAQGGVPEGHPTIALQKRLMRTRQQGLKITPREQLALVFYAWNAVQEGRTLRNLRSPRALMSADKFPDPAGWNATHAAKVAHLHISEEDVA